MLDIPSLPQVLVSLLVNGTGLGLVLLLRSAPPRVVLFLCVISMYAIFIPRTSLVVSDVDGNVRFEKLVVSDEGLSSFVGSLDVPGQTIGPGLVGLLFAVGLAWTTITVIQSLRLRGSSLVVTTGLIGAEVWVGDRIQDSEQARTALNHELCHIAAGDQFTLFVIVVIERLLWWNPLVWLLGRQARRQMEYACDSRCQQLLGRSAYRNSLAELFLEQRPDTPALGVSLGNGSDIIGRMERIGMQYALKKSHVLTLLAGSTLIAAASTNLAAQDIEERPSLVQCHELLPENVQYDLKITSAIDTREKDRNTIRMTLVDATKAGAEDELPKEAGEFLQCLQKVIGVGDDEGWPEV